MTEEPCNLQVVDEAWLVSVGIVPCCCCCCCFILGKRDAKPRRSQCGKSVQFRTTTVSQFTRVGGGVEGKGRRSKPETLHKLEQPDAIHMSPP